MFKALKRIFSARMQFLYLNGLEEEKKEQSVRLAVQGLILSIVGTILSVGLVVAGTLCAQQFTVTTDAGAVSAILGLFGAIVFYALALVSFIGGVLDGISFSLLQTKLNKKTIGKVALIISWVCFALSIGAIIAILVVML